MKIERGNGGLERVLIANDECEAELYLNGATLTSWKPRSQSHPVLWTSKQANWIAGKAIRGGVPLCFPWFGPKAGAAQHGWARTSVWTLDQADDRRLILSLPERDGLAARYVVHAGKELAVEFAVTNLGAAPVKVEIALHAYFRVADCRAIQIGGLEGAPLVIGEEVDRLFNGTAEALELQDPGLKRRITIEKEGSRSTVVWNPWIDKAKALADFGDDEWKEMVCIEPGNIGEDALLLAPGQSHTTGMRVRATLEDL